MAHGNSTEQKKKKSRGTIHARKDNLHQIKQCAQLRGNFPVLTSSILTK